MTAELIEYSKCMQSNGISWVAQDLAKSYEPESQMFYEFSPWTEDMANRFGSVQPMSKIHFLLTDLLYPNLMATTRDIEKSYHPHTNHTLVTKDIKSCNK